MIKKIILVDAVNCLVDSKGKINTSIFDLIENFENKKIVLTNADDQESLIYLKNIPYNFFTMKHKPDKPNPNYYRKFLETFSLEANEVIYFEHDIKAVESARSVGIPTHHFDGDIKRLESYLNLSLKKTGLS